MEHDIVIVAGFGFRRTVSTASLRAALALAQHGQPPVTALAAPQDKAGALAALAMEKGLRIIAVPTDALEATPTLTQSVRSHAARATGSVAEAAALAAAGLDARLIAVRHISPDRMATCAIAQGSSE